ncbi:MAG TPA: glycosyltransferase family 4 protein [Candidatus Acidoferrales bacterium]|nr:glycosyltransferase family 4 protein [Candidatus Acidoferrales bacterium]
MRILHIDTHPEWRGGQFLVLVTMRGQRARNHDVQLMALRDTLLARRAAAEGVPVHYIPRRFVRLGGALCLREILDQQRFDVVHVHDPHALTLAWLARAHRHAALMISRRLALPPNRGFGQARYRAARRIIAVSNFVARTVISSGVPADRVVVVHDGVEIPAETTAEVRSAARAKWGIGKDETLLGCVGYLVPGKRQDIALRAFANVLKRFPNCKLLIAGDGQDRAVLEELTEELRIANKVLFAGFVEDVERVYRALDIFLFPSVGEALPTSLLVAMSHRLPCVAAASGAVPEMVNSGKNGILVGSPIGATLQEAIASEGGIATSGTSQDVKEKSAVEFADAICNLLADPGYATRMAAAARQTIVDRFSIDALTEGTLNVYKSALHQT